MRRVQIGDLLALAAVVAGQADPRPLALRFCAEAHAAHAYAKRTGRLHPLWGNGSLMSRALAGGVAMQTVWDAEGIAALGIAVAALQEWRGQGLDCRGPRLCARKTL